MQVFKNVNILTKRPEGMSFKKYKEVRRAQKKEIKRYLNGRPISEDKQLIKAGQPIMSLKDMVDYTTTPFVLKPEAIV